MDTICTICISSVVSIICMLFPIYINNRWRIADKKETSKLLEQQKQEQALKEEQEKLNLKVCEEIASHKQRLFVKVINDSSYVEVTNVVVEATIRNVHQKLYCELKTCELGQRVLYSKGKAKDNKDSEVIIAYDAKSITKHIFNKNLLKKYNNNTLTLKDLIKDDTEIVISVRAVNIKTNVVTFLNPQYYIMDKIKEGFFRVGEDFVSEISQAEYADNP